MPTTVYFFTGDASPPPPPGERISADPMCCFFWEGVTDIKKENKKKMCERKRIKRTDKREMKVKRIKYNHKEQKSRQKMCMRNKY
jgi:hypothetical protein